MKGTDEIINMAFANAEAMYPTITEPRLSLSKKHPLYGLIVANTMKNYRTHHAKDGLRRQSIKRLIETKTLQCVSCGSNEFKDAQEGVLCVKCGVFELKKHILTNNFSKVRVPSRVFIHAKRAKYVFEFLKGRYDETHIQNLVRKYCLKDFELGFIKLMCNSFKVREELIKRYNLGFLTSGFESQRTAETAGYNSLHNQLVNKAFAEELANEGNILG